MCVISSRNDDKKNAHSSKMRTDRDSGHLGWGYLLTCGGWGKGRHPQADTPFIPQPPSPLNKQTPVKTLPSPILLMRSVITLLQPVSNKDDMDIRLTRY